MKPVIAGLPVPRYVFHAVVGLVLVTMLYLLPKLVVVAAFALITIIFIAIELITLRVPRLRVWFCTNFALLVRKEEHARLTGASYFMIGALITTAAFPKEIAMLAILLLAFGDPAASAIGRWRGRVRIWNKSLEGDLACFVSCLIVGGVFILIFGKPPVQVVITGAVFAALFQALPIRLNDNITIPVCSGAAMMLASLLF